MTCQKTHPIFSPAMITSPQQNANKYGWSTRGSSMSPTRKASAHRTRDFSERNVSFLTILGRSTLTRPTTIVCWRKVPPRRSVTTPKAGPWQVVLPSCPVPPSASFCSPSYSSLGELAHHHNSVHAAIACNDDGTSPSPSPTPTEARKIMRGWIKSVRLYVSSLGS